MSVVAVAVCTLAGCSGGHSGDPAGAASPALSPPPGSATAPGAGSPSAVSPTGRTSFPHSAPVASPASRGALNTTRTCADVRTIRTLNDAFNAPDADLAKGKRLAASLKRAADRLVLNETDDISTDAHTFAFEVGVVDGYVDKAASLTQLAREAQADPRLRDALSQVVSAENALTAWAAANC